MLHVLLFLFTFSFFISNNSLASLELSEIEQAIIADDFGKFGCSRNELEFITVRQRPNDLKPQFFSRKIMWQDPEKIVHVQSIIGFEQLNEIAQHYCVQPGLVLQFMRFGWQFDKEIVGRIKSVRLFISGDDNYDETKKVDAPFMQLTFEPALPYQVWIRPYDFSGAISPFSSELFAMCLRERFGFDTILIQRYHKFCKDIYDVVFCRS